MTIFFEIILLYAVVSFFIRRQRNSYLSLKYRYKIYALRDKLRGVLIDDKINKNDWVFDYFDSSFSKLVNQLDMLTIYKAILLYLLNRNNKVVKTFSENLSSNLKRSNTLTEIYVEYGNILLDFFVEKHSTSAKILVSTVSTFGFLNRVKKGIKNYILDLRYLPETSDYSLAKA